MNRRHVNAFWIAIAAIVTLFVGAFYNLTQKTGGAEDLRAEALKLQEEGHCLRT